MEKKNGPRMHPKGGSLVWRGRVVDPMQARIEELESEVRALKVENSSLKGRIVDLVIRLAQARGVSRGAQERHLAVV